MVAGCLILGISAILIVKFKKNGLMAAITSIGYVALINLILKVSGTIVTVSGLFAMVAGIAINYYLVIEYLYMLYHYLKIYIHHKNNYINFLYILF